MLLDKYLPGYDYREVNRTTIETNVEDLFIKVLACDLGRNSIIRLLFRLRGMNTPIHTIEDLERMGFIKLDQEPGKEVVYGMVTHSAMFNSCLEQMTPSEFINYSDPSSIKAIINLNIETRAGLGHTITTETRILCGSPKMKSRFRFYWFFVRPFSQLSRKLMLREIKKQVLPPTLNKAQITV
jgi:hypothetical protein